MDRISYAGYEAEVLFEENVSIAIKTSAPGRGDKRVTVDDKVYYVEIKKCGAEKGGTINQVRAIKYLTVAVYTPNHVKPWIVIPPNVVVELAAEKERGQHSEVPFESAAIRLDPNWADLYRVNTEDLEAAVIDAVREGEKCRDLKLAMSRLMYDLKRMSHNTRMEVSSLLKGTKPTYW